MSKNGIAIQKMLDAALASGDVVRGPDRELRGQNGHGLAVVSRVWSEGVEPRPASARARELPKELKFQE